MSNNSELLAPIKHFSVEDYIDSIILFATIITASPPRSIQGTEGQIFHFHWGCEAVLFLIECTWDTLPYVAYSVLHPKKFVFSPDMNPEMNLLFKTLSSQSLQWVDDGKPCQS